MTDRELLELAAKAAEKEGWEYVENECRNGRRVWGYYSSLMEVCWNPLTYDGDAMRLAAKLGLAVRIEYQVGSTSVLWWARGGYVRESHGGDPYAATRRAIVRAAAEIGKGIV